MSITLLIEQNVYRYYALTDHTLSLLFTRHQQVCVFLSVSCDTLSQRFDPCLCFYFCNRSFLWTTKAWNGDGDTADRWFFYPSRLRYTAAQSNRLTHINLCDSPAWTLETNKRVISGFNWRQTNTSILRCTVEHLAVVIQMLAWRHLSQQHITSTLLTFTHNVYFRFVICCFFLTGHKYT